MNSTKFKQVLELVLLMGNYLNTGSRNARSIGFDIGFLAKVLTNALILWKVPAFKSEQN